MQFDPSDPCLISLCEQVNHVKETSSITSKMEVDKTSFPGNEADKLLTSSAGSKKVYVEQTSSGENEEVADAVKRLCSSTVKILKIALSLDFSLSAMEQDFLRDNDDKEDGDSGMSMKDGLKFRSSDGCPMDGLQSAAEELNSCPPATDRDNVKRARPDSVVRCSKKFRQR